jgi:membrane fusion protein (multidrug efflux system)
VLSASARLASLEQLRGDLATAESELMRARLDAQRLAREIAERQVRAPVAGRIAEPVTVRPGALVRAGERLTSVVPAGRLRVVADFKPGAAIGRIRRGQRARMRLEGFSPVEYGMLAARVEEVAAEPRNGLVRVELSIVRAPAAIPLQHGLPGVVEVELERVAPATIFLRAAGKRMHEG